MKIENWSDLIKKIKEATSIAICSHVSPDGDNIGSVLSMGAGLKSLGYNPVMWKVDEIPKNLRFLPGISEMVEPKVPCDLLIILDCSDRGRLGEYESLLSEVNTVVNIDHHKSNDNFGDLNYVVPGAAATGELVFDFLKSAGVKWSENIAIPLYTAISSDTGSFMYDSTTPETLVRASELLGVIKKPNIITENLYQSKTLIQVKLLSRVLNNLKIIPEINTAVGKITIKDLEEFQAESDDTDSIVSFVNGLDEAKITVFIKEKEPEITRVSLRSKGDYDVAKIAEIFGGGGHKKAAGLTYKGNSISTEEDVLKKIKETYFNA